MAVVKNRFQQIVLIVVVMLATRALFGDAIAGSMDGLVIGFNDGV